MIGAALAAALLVALALGSAWAQQTQTLQLTPSRNSGVSGTATLTDTGSGVEVQLDMQGMHSADGTEHLVHIHEGATCADDRADQGGPIDFPLEPVTNQGGAGSSTSTIDTSLDKLLSAPHYVNLHAEMSGGGVHPGISCDDIVATASSLPSTGGIVSPLTAALLLGGAAFVSLAGVAGILARRRA